jgi:hypothetical protein
VGFGIDRRARSRKGRTWFRRGPDAREVGERLARLGKRMERQAFVRATWQGPELAVTFAMHPAAEPVSLRLGADAELAVTAETATLGPGYHSDVLARLAPILDELDYTWSDTERDVPTAMCEWLAQQLRGAAPAVQVRLVERPFVSDAPVLTMLGPRDAAWRDAVLADPKHAADAFPWWETGPGRAALSRALVAMWHEVPWREPLDAAERDAMRQADADLREAHDAAPSLALPWADWAELQDLLGGIDEDVREKSLGGRATIGYRRGDLDVELSGGWSIRMPATFLGAWEDDDARYWATDGDRALDFTSLTANDEGDSDRLLAVAPEKHDVIARLSDGSRRGRAEVHHDGEVSVVHGLVCDAPHVALLTCKGGDREWALATWRSLRRT